MGKRRNSKNNSFITSIAFILIISSVLFSLIYFSENDTRNLKSIGYTNEEISFIRENKIPIKVIEKYKHIDVLKDIVTNKNYDRKNIDKYLSLYNENRDINIIIYMANNNISYDYSDKLVLLITNKYFILNNLDRYMKYNSDDIDNIISMVNSNRDYEYYTNTKKSDVSKGILLLVNKYYYLDEDYSYDELVEIESNYSNNKNNMLSKEAYEAFKKLVDDASKEGLNIRSNYAYRTYSYQEGVYNEKKDSDGVSYADSISARPGYSEHQTGLALDVGVLDKYADVKFQYTKEYDWMKDNSYKYGFILRYPLGKENITGYNFESWHYRYVGVDAAKIIYDNNLTFEEYYAYYVDNK